MSQQGLLAVYLRIQGRLEEAKDLIVEALRVIEASRLNRGKEIQQKIRLGHVLQFQEDFRASNALFEQILEVCESDPELKHYLPFALQHSGKNQFDQKNYQNAKELFQRALKIRRAAGVPEEQIESTRFALQRTDGMLGLCK